MHCKYLFPIALVSLGIATEASAQSYYKNKAYQWKGNEIIQGKWKARVLSPTEITSSYVRQMSDGFMGWDNDPINRQPLTLEFADCVENMNMVENKALLKQLRIVKIR